MKKHPQVGCDHLAVITTRSRITIYVPELAAAAAVVVVVVDEQLC